MTNVIDAGLDIQFMWLQLITPPFVHILLPLIVGLVVVVLASIGRE